MNKIVKQEDVKKGFGIEEKQSLLNSRLRWSGNDETNDEQ
jgi:hypothetical protein